jgi:hypothetical protein
MGLFTVMGWDTFSKDNALLHKHFGGTEVTKSLNLKCCDGFFLCPDD